MTLLYATWLIYMWHDSFYTSQPHAPHQGYESHHTLTGEESRYLHTGRLECDGAHHGDAAM